MSRLLCWFSMWVARLLVEPFGHLRVFSQRLQRAVEPSSLRVKLSQTWLLSFPIGLVGLVCMWNFLCFFINFLSKTVKLQKAQLSFSPGIDTSSFKRPPWSFEVFNSVLIFFSARTTFSFKLSISFNPLSNQKCWLELESNPGLPHANPVSWPPDHETASLSLGSVAGLSLREAGTKLNFK